MNWKACKPKALSGIREKIFVDFDIHGTRRRI